MDPLWIFGSALFFFRAHSCLTPGALCFSCVSCKIHGSYPCWLRFLCLHRCVMSLTGHVHCAIYHFDGIYYLVCVIVFAAAVRFPFPFCLRASFLCAGTRLSTTGLASRRTLFGFSSWTCSTTTWRLWTRHPNSSPCGSFSGMITLLTIRGLLPPATSP